MKRQQRRPPKRRGIAPLIELAVSIRTLHPEILDAPEVSLDILRLVRKLFRLRRAIRQRESAAFTVRYERGDFR
jgi:hypothetical protein